MKFRLSNTYTIHFMGLCINLKSEKNNPWFKQWLDILLCTQSIVCVLGIYNFEYASFMNILQACRSRRCNGTPLPDQLILSFTTWKLEPLDFQTLALTALSCKTQLHENRNATSEHILLPPQYDVIPPRSTCCLP